MVIAGADQHHCVPGQAQRGQRNRGSSIAGARLDDDLGSRLPAKLRLDLLHMRRAGDDDRRREAPIFSGARERRLEQGLIADQRQERLGLYRPAARPQPRAAAAAQDYRGDGSCHGKLLIRQAV